MRYKDEVFMKNLEALIKRSGKTKSKVAEDLGISRQALSLWLNGRSFPTGEGLDKIAKYFKISKVMLFVGDFN